MSSSLQSFDNENPTGGMSLREAINTMINEAVWDPFLSDVPFGSAEGFSGEDFPHVDLIEEPTRLVLHADIPGFKAEDLDIQVEADAITVSGTMESTYEDHDGAIDIHHYERETGSFIRTLPLPVAVIPEKVEAHIEHGVLSVFLPKVKQTNSVPTPKKVTPVAKSKKKAAKVTTTKKGKK